MLENHNGHQDGEQYPKAPIVEAAIAVVFGEPFDEKTLLKIKDRLQRRYENARQLIRLEVQMKGDKAIGTRRLQEGYQLSDHDQQHNLLLRPGEISTTVLAPYPGWNVFANMAMQNYVDVREIGEYRKVARVGVRYINRIDIPFPNDRMPIESLDYVTVGPIPRPDFLHKTRMFNLRLESDAEDGLRVVITTGIADPVVVDHLSIILDIDVIELTKPPQKSDEIWACFNYMRKMKNFIFESCITDKARELFR